MSERCIYCGCFTSRYIWVEQFKAYCAVCEDCEKEQRRGHISARLRDVHGASDFSCWKMEDMSEAFWMHLIRYQKHPNKRSLNIMQTAYLWACHADHGLSNSFSHALDWCGVDLFNERRKELPEE